MRLNEEQRLLRDTARDVAQNLLAPHAAEWDREARFPKEALVAHPFPGKWSACEIVHHLADSEATSGLRLRKLLTEEYPVIQGYDQDAWARTLGYRDVPLAMALDQLGGIRMANLRLWHSLTAAQRKAPRSRWRMSMKLRLMRPPSNWSPPATKPSAYRAT